MRATSPCHVKDKIQDSYICSANIYPVWYNCWSSTDHRYNELANMIPRRKLSLANPNFFSRFTSPTASAAAFSWQTNQVSWFDKGKQSKLIFLTIYRTCNRKVKCWACRKGQRRKSMPITTSIDGDKQK